MVYGKRYERIICSRTVSFTTRLCEEQSMASALKCGCGAEIKTAKHSGCRVGAAEHQSVGIVEDGIDTAVTAA